MLNKMHLATWEYFWCGGNNISKIDFPCENEVNCSTRGEIASTAANINNPIQPLQSDKNSCCTVLYVTSTRTLLFQLSGIIIISSVFLLLRGDELLW